MKQYIGTKCIEAQSQNVQGKDGYEVVYSDGYRSWSPKAQFEDAYRDITANMSFGHAVEMLKRGWCVSRAGWNGRGMWLSLNRGAFFCEPQRGKNIELEDHIVMKTADDKFIPWLASQADVLADDWSVVK